MNEDALAFTQNCIEEITRQGTSLGREACDWLLKRLNSRWYPRDKEAAAQHLINRVGHQPFFLYGAGTHSLALLEHLASHPILKQLQGLLDSKALPDQMLKGYPVFPAAHALEQTQPVIVLSHQEFEDGMRDDLLALGVPETRIFPIYQDDQYGGLALQKLMPQLKAQVDSLEPHPNRMVFVSARPRGIVDKTMIAKLAEDETRQTVRLRMDRGEAVDDQGFEATFNAHNSLFLCLYLLSLLKPRAIYVQEHYSSGNFLPLAVALAFPETPVLGEFYDFLGLTFDDPHILATESYWRHEDVELALAAERWCVKHLSGLVTKEDGPVLDRYLQGARVLKIQPCMDRQHFSSQTSPLGNPPRLVWAGAIAPSHLSSRMFGDNQLLDVFRKLLDLGFHVQAWSSARDQTTLENLYSDYLALDPPFAIHPALPREALIQKLAAEQDFGLMLGVPKVDTQQGISHKVTVSGKLHTYLAAGLPIITGTYLEVMAQWVQEYELGLAVDVHRLEDLSGLINPGDYQKWARNVRRFRESRHLGTVVAQLARFLEQT